MVSIVPNNALHNSIVELKRAIVILESARCSSEEKQKSKIIEAGQTINSAVCRNNDIVRFLEHEMSKKKVSK